MTNTLKKLYINGTEYNIPSESNTKTFTLSSLSDTTTAANITDWCDAGNTAIIILDDQSYYLEEVFRDNYKFAGLLNTTENNLGHRKIKITKSGGNYTITQTLQSVKPVTIDTTQFITGVKTFDKVPSISSSVSPSSDYQLTNKKYVDDRDVYIGTSAPASNLVEGRLWYDTTNDVLKTYDGTNWNAVGGGGSGDVTGPSSSTDGHLAVFDGATGKIIKDGGAVPAAQVQTDWNATTGMGVLLNKPTLGTAASKDTGTSSGNVPVLDSNGKISTSVMPTTMQTTSNLKTSLTDNSDSYYPSQKAVKTAVDTKQDALTTQTAYTSQGTATKVPTITTNTLGQVTGITETNISFPVTSVNGQTGAVTVSGGIPNNTTGTTSTVTGIRAGTETEYTNLNSKSGSVLYFTF